MSRAVCPFLGFGKEEGGVPNHKWATFGDWGFSAGRWPQDGCRKARRWPQEGPKMAQDSHKMAPTKMAQDGIKMALRWPKEARRWPQEGMQELLLLFLL